MPNVKIKKDGQEYDLQTMPLHYPADRVYLDGDTSKTVQDAISAGRMVRSFDSIYWGNSKSISRIRAKSMLIIGGRQDMGFILYIPANTLEYVTLSNPGNKLTGVSMSDYNSVTLTVASSGYGSSILIEVITFI